MSTFRVSFFKTICDSTGHDHQVMQSSVAVEAPTPEQAAALARRVIGLDRHMPRWGLYAESIRVEALAAVAAEVRPGE